MKCEICGEDCSYDYFTIFDEKGNKLIVCPRCAENRKEDVVLKWKEIKMLKK